MGETEFPQCTAVSPLVEASASLRERARLSAQSVLWNGKRAPLASSSQRAAGGCLFRKCQEHDLAAAR
jgi:hypothetical protein